MRTLALAASLVLILAAGCTGPKTVDDLPDELRQSAILSMAGPGKLPESGTYTFHPQSAVIVDNERFDAREIEGLIRDALTVELAAQGWFPAPGGTTTVGYLVALDDPLHEDTVKNVLGIDPGLAPTAGHHERGTLLVELHRSGTNVTLWRGAVQILADPDLPEDLRNERARRAIRALLQRMP